MIDLTGVQHHPALEEIVDMLCNKTQNTDKGFFRVEVAYFFAKMASNMRASIVTKDRGEIPVNLYALNLATSGFGKGHSVSIMENDLMKGFQARFLEETFPVISEKHLYEMATKRAARNATDEQEELEKVEKEFRSAGAFPFTFDSGTPPAVKQLRNKLLLASCGAINLQIDEIGSNLIGSTDVLTLFLELFDQGMVKQKLVKNTNDSVRAEEIAGKTPSNMLLFGTPSKLLDGGQTEDQFYSFLETGYARRCLFGFGHKSKQAAFTQETPEEIYKRLIEPKNEQSLKKWADMFTQLADPAKHGWKMVVEDEVGIALVAYKMACEQYSATLKDHEDMRKAEIDHRYFKALKLAGAYAFIDLSTEIEMEHLLSAILLVEESGESFKTILNREKAYVKLAKFIADIGTEQTHADLIEALPFYPKGNAPRNDMMNLATAWGYKQHIIIKKSFVDGIEFFKGEKLEETDLNEIIVSYSDHWAYNYLNEKVPFDQLSLLTQNQGMHWANHHFRLGHRAEENVSPGFNAIVIDIDEGISLSAAHDLMSDYKYMTYTTKRHTEDQNRFRMIIPINYILELDSDEYKEFMNCFMEWLPFKTDEAANQRSKKWESFGAGEFHYNMDGQIMDALRFIPKTTKNENHIKEQSQLASLDNLERWFAQRIASGNRNNHMIKYALALVDSGMTLMDVNKQVHAFNKKLNTPLTEAEIDQTIMVTVAKRYQKA